MGKEITVTTLEEMCELMCDNYVEDEEEDFLGGGNNAMKLLDYNFSNHQRACKYVSKFVENGIAVIDFTAHDYGILCYPSVRVYYYLFKTIKDLHIAGDLAQKEGFSPILIVDGREPRFDPYEILLSQPITKGFSKQIRAEIKRWNEEREEEMRHRKAMAKIRKRYWDLQEGE